MIVEKSIRRFLKELSSSRPVPGGGSVSAVVAAQAAGLVSMACEISLKHETSRKNKNTLRIVGGAARKLVKLGLKLAESDVKVFTKLIRCFKKRYSSRTARRKSVQRAISFCTASCLDLALLTRDGMHVTRHAAGCVKADMCSEVHTALHLWEAAFHGARINTEANLAWVKDKRLKVQSRSFIRKVSSEVGRDKKIVLKTLSARKGKAK